MQIIEGLDSLPQSLVGGVVTIGKFDGVHLGHVKILRHVKVLAKTLGSPSVVLTFDRLPISVLRPELGLRPICTLARRLELIQLFDVDAVVVLPATSAFFRQTAEDFFTEQIVGKLQAKAIVEGENFQFGNRREGSPATMQSLSAKYGVQSEVVLPFRLNTQVVSSSWVRDLLFSGELEAANQLMPLAYRMTGTVVHGEHRGRTLGFPTANLGNIETIVPKDGIYLSVVWFNENRYLATTHLGANVTFNEKPVKVESFLHDFSGDIYGKTIHVDLVQYLRGIVKFDSVETLKEQIHKDIEQSRLYANELRLFHQIPPS